MATGNSLDAEAATQVAPLQLNQNGKAPAGPSEAELVMDMCTAHWKQQAIRAAVKLGVMDAPGMLDSAVPISQLAAHTSSNGDHLYRLPRYLAQFGIFEELPGQHFKLTSMGRYLRADHPSGLRYASLSAGDPGQFMPWMHLDMAVKQGKSAFGFFQPHLPGGFFQYVALPENKAQKESFNTLMTAVAKTMDVGVAARHDFSDFRVVADIAGGYGRLLEDIMDAYPGVQEGIVFEMPSVVDMVPPVPDKDKGKISWVKTVFDGKERTAQQWHDLMGQAGFTIKSITQAPSMAAIVAVPSGPN